MRLAFEFVSDAHAQLTYVQMPSASLAVGEMFLFFAGWLRVFNGRSINTIALVDHFYHARSSQMNIIEEITG